MSTLSADQLTYRAAGMTCEHCRLAVTEEVTKVAGVTGVDVDLDTKLVRVHGTEIDSAAVVAAIDEAGYDAVQA
jgi:copper chaperone CopZ